MLSGQPTINFYVIITDSRISLKQLRKNGSIRTDVAVSTSKIIARD